MTYKGTWEHTDGILTVRRNVDKPHVATWEPTGKRNAGDPVAWTVEFTSHPATAYEVLGRRLAEHGGWRTEEQFRAEVAALSQTCITEVPAGGSDHS